jgi:Bacterial Ig domain/FG-GAP-like repeat/FG-GAP repeat
MNDFLSMKPENRFDNLSTLFRCDRNGGMACVFRFTLLRVALMLRNTLSKWSAMSRSQSLLIRPMLLNISGHLLEERTLLSFGVSGLLSPIAATSQPIAEVAAGTRLASIDTTQSVLLNGLLSDLAGGTSLNLTVLDYNGLAGGDLNLGHLLTSLQNQFSLPTADAALTANVTLGQLLASAQLVAQADGNPALATTLGTAQSQLNSLTGTIQPGQLLQFNLPTQSLAQAEVNALDLLVGGVQLYNLGNVLGTSGSVNLTGPQLGGLTSVASSVTLQAQIVDAPVITIGGAGSQFASAQIRLKLNVDLVDASFNTTALLSSIQTLLGPLATVNATAFVGGLELYVDVARGTGTIQAISAITDAVTLQATPSIADVYLGTIPDSLFFNRGRVLNPVTDLTPTTIGGVTVNVTTLGVPAPAINFGLTARAVSNAAPASSSVLTFTPTFPDSTTIGSGAVAVGNAVTSLLSNLQVGTTGALGLLNPIASTMTANLLPTASAALRPALTAVLGNVADPALNTLGIRIGEMDLAVLGADSPDRALANNDAALTLANRPVNVRVLANDIIPAGATQTLTIASTPAHGSVAINSDNSVTFTPTADYTGSDSFAYSLTDAFGRVSSASVSVFVGFAPIVNAAPTLAPDTASTTGSPVTISVLANDSDPDGDPLSVVGVTQPAHGTAVANADGTVTYTPFANFLGSDSFSYAAGDGKGGIALAQVTINVGGGATLNAAPTARPDVATVLQGAAVTTNVLANDTDPDNDRLRVASITQGAHGTVLLGAAGEVTYIPEAGFIGIDSFFYVADDGQGGTATSLVTITVERSNSSPTALPDFVFTTKNIAGSTDVLRNDTDPDNDNLTLESITQPAHGTVSIGAGGVVRYTPNAGYVGTDSFTYTTSDGQGGTATGTVNVTVTRGNSNPVSAADNLSTTVNVPVTTNILLNDIDPDGDTFSILNHFQPLHGSVVVAADGTVTYTPNAGFVGTDSFAYTITDELGGISTEVATVTVNPVVVPPVVPPEVPPVVPPSAPPVTPPAVPPSVPPVEPPAATPVLEAPVFQRVFCVVGANTTGGPRLTVYGSDGSEQFNFFAYDSSIRVGASGAIGDVNGDGIADLVTAPGLGGGPHIRILNGKDLSSISDFFAFESDIRTGATVSVGDVNGDGFGDVIVGAGVGGGPRVSVFSGQDGTLLKNFFAFDSSYRSGVRVGEADFNGDGLSDIIVTTGAGPATRVRVFDGATNEVLQDIAPYGDDYTAGAYVSGGDFNADGVPDLIVGAGANESRVQIFSGLTTNVLANYMAYESQSAVGVSVSARDLDNDGHATIMTGPGQGGGPRFTGLQTTDLKRDFDYFTFEDTFRGGITVG